MLFFNEKFEPTIINENIKKENIQNWCDKHGVYIQIIDNSTYWAGFANFYGQNHGLSVVEAGSFSSMVSQYISGMGVSCGTDVYFREEDIDYEILNIYNGLKRKCRDNEKELAEKLFYAIFDLYKNDIEKYSFKIHMLTFRLSETDYDNFMNVEGKSKVEKLRALMKNYYSK